MEIPDVFLPEGLARAWTSEMPGPVQPPGPRNAPARGSAQPPGPAGIPVTAMLRAIWWSETFHLNPATGLPGKVRQRAVPSAGGCYPVQLRVLCGAGCDVPPGTYMFHHGHAEGTSDGGLLRLHGQDAVAHLTAGVRAPGRGAVVVLTVLPQRTASKYHHRAGPLLIADTAYAAVALVHHAAALEVPAGWSVLAPQHWPGPIPEFTVAAVTLGAASGGIGNTREDTAGPRIAGVTEAQLATRRSADVSGPRARASCANDSNTALQRLLDSSLPTFPEPVPSSCRIRLLTGHLMKSPLLPQRCAGQHWVRNLHALVVFETSITPTHESMWWSAALAAHILYTALGTDTSLDFRPVGGWTGTDNGWTTLHGLGIVLRETDHNTHERPAHAGQ
ncbi:hypothetical protein M1D51_11445 [Arthrobacter sp. R3-55]